MSAHVQLWRVLTLLKFVCLVLSSFLRLIFPLETFISSQSQTQTALFSYRRRSCGLILFFFKVLLSLLLAASKNHHSTAFFFFATVTQDEEINSGCKAQCQEISPAYATELRGSRNTPVCFGQRVIYFAACFSTTKNAAFTSQLIVNSWKHLMWKI